VARVIGLGLVGPRRRGFRFALMVASGLGLGEARAQDRFEIQVYDSLTAPPGGVGVELHANVVADGTRSPSPEGELPTQSVLHLTAEPHLGLAPWTEVGCYLQTAVRDGVFDWAGFKARWKVRLPRKLAGDRIGLALNMELSDVPARYEANVWGSELRPIVDLRAGRFYASINPIVAIDLAGPLAGHPQFEPAAKLALEVGAAIAVGLEYYGAIGPFDAPLPWSGQTHRLFAVLDWAHPLGHGGAAVDLNVGAGYNLPGTGDRWVVKAIVGVGR
jgi:hypothetical protein